MPRVNRQARVKPQGRPTRAQVLELLVGPNGPESAFRDEGHRLTVWRGLRKEVSPDFEAQWFASTNEHKPFAAIANQYARQVVAGELAACLFVRQACRRHLDDLERGVFQFDEAKAERACRFIELLPHVKGKWAAKAERIVLAPWQVFIVCNIFGWVKCDVTRKRRFTLVYIEVARKNAKSTMAAGIGCYCFAADEEFGAEVYSGATKEDQALEVFRPAMEMMDRSPELAMVLGITVGIRALTIASNGSRFRPVVRNPGDGSSPHCAIVDEYHEHETDKLYDTFRTGMGAREQPFELVITTSGDNLAGPCKLLRGDIEKVLNGSTPGDEVFGIIYTIDDEKLWTTEEALRMANPNLDVSVSLEFLKTEQAAAVVKPRKQGVFKTKHLCLWVGAVMAYFDVGRWKSLADPTLRPGRFIGCPCVIALDLSSKKDLTAVLIVFKELLNGKEHYYAFSRFYLPESQAKAPDKQHYHDWVHSGALRVNDGEVIDLIRVTSETKEAVRTYGATEVAYDPWNAEHLSQEIVAQTKAVPVEIRQNTGLLSAPTKELDVLITDGLIHHDGNPVLSWNIGNVTCHEDKNENVFPQKEPGREEKKIDGAIALIMCVARLMVMPMIKKRSVYAERGLLTL